MRVVVTGARGQLGEPLVAALAGDERVGDVVGIDTKPPVREQAGVRQVLRDVRDPGLAQDLAGTDAVIHLAMLTFAPNSTAQSVNVDGSRNVFACALACGASTIVHTSSATAYGAGPDTRAPFTEDDPLVGSPGFYYPRTKAAVEQLLDELSRQRPGVRTIRLRPVMIVGPRTVMTAAGRVYISLSDFDPLMQFVWIDDVVQAIRGALLEPRASGAYNLGAPEPVRSSSVASLIGARHLRLPYRLRHGIAAMTHAARLPGGLHPGFVELARYPTVVDTTRIERELGWRASLDCSGVLRRYGAALRARPALA